MASKLYDSTASRYTPSENRSCLLDAQYRHFASLSIPVHLLVSTTSLDLPRAHELLPSHLLPSQDSIMPNATLRDIVAGSAGKQIRSFASLLPSDGVTCTTLPTLIHPPVRLVILEHVFQADDPLAQLLSPWRRLRLSLPSQPSSSLRTTSCGTAAPPAQFDGPAATVPSPSRTVRLRPRPREQDA